MRINKFLAECGLASRRNCETLVTGGRVKINGKKVTNLATEVNEETDLVSVDDKPVKPIGKHLYILLNKPKGYVCTTSDEHGRKTVMDFFAGKYEGKRLFPVGRLDYDTEGMLLMTTDGDLSNRLMHPRNEITKTYVAKIEGEISEEELNKLREGVVLDGVKTKKSKIKLLGYDGKISRIEVVISEGTVISSGPQNVRKYQPRRHFLKARGNRRDQTRRIVPRKLPRTQTERNRLS